MPPGFVVRPDFVTEAEEAAFLSIANDIMAERPYRGDHYDSVISGYRECFVERWVDAAAEAAATRAREYAWEATAEDDGRGRRSHRGGWRTVPISDGRKR